MNEKEWTSTIHLTGDQKWVQSTNIMVPMPSERGLGSFILEFWSFVLRCHTIFGVRVARITLEWVFGKHTCTASHLIKSTSLIILAFYPSYNAEKKKVGMYYSTPIYQFRFKCHLCPNHIEMKTDPAVCFNFNSSILVSESILPFPYFPFRTWTMW